MSEQHISILENKLLGKCTVKVACKQKSKNAPVAIFMSAPGFKITDNLIKQLAAHDLFVVGIQAGMEDSSYIQSTYTTYLNDIQVVIEWLSADDFAHKEMADLSDLSIIGIDRGATAAITATIEDARLRQSIALSPLIDPMITYKSEGAKAKMKLVNGDWIESSLIYEEDYKQNLERLSLQSNIAKYDKSLYIYYGTKDDPQVLADIETVYDFVIHAVMVPIENVGHDLGWNYGSEELSDEWKTLCEEIAEVINM